MTVPPAEPAGQPRHAVPKPPRGITHLVFTDALPPEMGASAQAEGRVILVNASWPKGKRLRRAVRAEMHATHRYPGLAVWGVLASDRIRRVLYGAADWLTSLAQHAGTMVASNQGVTAAVAAVVVGGTVATGVAAGVVPVPSFAAPAHGLAGGKAPAISVTPIHVKLPAYPASYLGVYEPGTPASYIPVDKFADATGHRPNLALYYASIEERFMPGFADAALANGATPVIQVDPDGASMDGIVAGQYDTYLTSLAQSVHAFGRGVVIGFGHEMNGGWYQWGYGHTDPATWVAAWKHIVNLFRAQGDYNVTWLWTINISGAHTGPIQDWWPGAADVSWCGIDGYFESPGDTFTSVFGPTINQIRTFTGKPILIAETAAGPGPDQASQIRSLFKGIRFRQILGFIWFDRAQNAGVHHQNWRLEGDASALTAFREAARGYK